MTPAPPRTSAPVRGLVAGSLILLFAVLPALLAGIRIDAPPAPGELHHVRQGMEPEAAAPELAGSKAARLFYGMTLWGEPPSGPLDPSSPEALSLLAQARLAQVLGVLGLALLTYLTVTLARGRGRALLACAALACMPAVYAEGHVLRPETPAALFALLALILAQGLPAFLRRPRTPPLSALAVVLVSATTTGLAVTCLPARMVYLLVPGAVMLFVAVWLTVRFSRVLRRRRFMVLPMRAFTLRLLPWLGLAFLSLLMTFLLLSVGLDSGSDGDPLTESALGLLPAAALPRYGLLVLLIVGAVSWMLRVGLRVGRRGRIDPEFLLLVYVAAVLVDRWFRGAGVDSLPAAVPAAILVGEGAAAVGFLALAGLRRQQ